MPIIDGARWTILGKQCERLLERFSRLRAADPSECRRREYESGIAIELAFKQVLKAPVADDSMRMPDKSDDTLGFARFLDAQLVPISINDMNEDAVAEFEVV